MSLLAAASPAPATSATPSPASAAPASSPQGTQPQGGAPSTPQGAGQPQGQQPGGSGLVPQTPTDKPWFAEFYDDKGQINPKAFDKLPPELAPYKDTFSRSKDVNGFMMQVANLASLAGRKGLAPLPENASEEVKTARAELMREINGVPKTPEDYGIKKPDGVPDEAWNNDYVQGALGIMHKHHMSPAAVRELVEFDLKFGEQIRGAHAQSIEARQMQQKEAGIKELKTYFKTEEAFNSAIVTTTRAAQTAGIPMDSPIWEHPDAIKLANFLGSQLSSDRLVAPEGSANSGLVNKAMGTDIINNKTNPLHEAYHNKNHPMHDQAMETVKRALMSGR